MPYTPDRSKCATILQGDREEQEQKWGEEYAKLVRTVEDVIELNTGFYIKDINSSTIPGIPTIDSKFSDVSNWTLGGSDGYGVFGADGQLHKEIENAKNYLTGWANPAGRAGASVTPTQKKEAEDLLVILTSFNSQLS